jgi:hypothetical protein
MRREILFLLCLSNALPACDASTPLPLDVEIKEGAGVAGGKWDELQLIVKSLPGAEIQFGNETKNMEGQRAVEQFRVPKSSLKLGKNSFVVRGKIAALLSKREGEKKVEWDAEPKALLRFQGSTKGDAEALSCIGAMCGQPTLKATKSGRIPIEVESAVAGILTVGGSKVDVTPGQRAALDLDLLSLVAGRNVGELSQVSVPFSFEASGPRRTTFELGGPALSDSSRACSRRSSKAPWPSREKRRPPNPNEACSWWWAPPCENSSPWGARPSLPTSIWWAWPRNPSGRSPAPRTARSFTTISRSRWSIAGRPKPSGPRSSARIAILPADAVEQLTGEVREDDVKRVLGEFWS